MKQIELMALLREAATPNCSWERRNEIQCRLSEASSAMGTDGTYKVLGEEAGMHLVLEKLYVDTIRNRPELLPSLFPAFAVICGDRQDGVICASVEWSLI